MSGNNIGTIIGGAIGFIVAGPTGLQWGMSIGGIAGGLLMPDKLGLQDQQGPQLQNLKITSATYGVPINRVYGTYRIGGNVIWSTPIKEIKHVTEEEVGKGGSESYDVITYTYSIDMAIALCEGPISSIRKVWADSVKIYDTDLGGIQQSFLTTDTMTFYLGTATQEIDWYLQSYETDAPAYRNIAYIVFNTLQLEMFGNRVPNITCEVLKNEEPYLTEISLSSIIEDQLIKSNINTYNVTAADSILVKGFMVQNVYTARSIITTLQSIYQFDLVEKNFQIVIILRGSSVIGEITNLGANSDNKIEITNSLNTELPKKITVKYSNIHLDYQNGSQSSQVIDVNSNNNIILELPIVFTDTEAKQLAEKLLYESWSSKTQLTFSIPFNDLYTVSDVVTLNYENILYTLRIISITYTSDYILNIEAVNEASYISTAIGSSTSNGFIGSSNGLHDPTNLEVFNAPTLDNSFINTFGIYYAASGSTENWNGCEVFKSNDLENTYHTIGVILKTIPMGTTTTLLESGNICIWDYSSVTIQLTYGTLYGISSESVLSGNNYIKIGSEILQYQDIIDNGDGTYTLSKLLRGRRGTELAIGTHSIGENFIFLNNEIQFSFSTINIERSYKGVSFGTYISDTTAVKETYDGTNLKPFSPSYLQSKRDINKDITLYWTRRDRYISGYFRTLPLSEIIESYNIDIIHNSILINSYISFNTTFLYDSEKHISDSITLGEEITFNVSQISTAVGNGYESSITELADL